MSVPTCGGWGQEIGFVGEGFGFLVVGVQMSAVGAGRRADVRADLTRFLDSGSRGQVRSQSRGALASNFQMSEVGTGR